MALQALKETKYSAARCRLSPPSSPSKRAASSSASAAMSKPQPFKSKLLAALDAEMENVLPRAGGSSQACQPGSLAAPQRLPRKPSVVAASAGGAGARAVHLANTCVVEPHTVLSHTTQRTLCSIHPFFQASKRKANSNPNSKPAAPMHSVAAVLTPGPLEPPPKVRKKTTMPPPMPITMDRLVQLAEENIVAVEAAKAAKQPPKEPVVYSYKDYSPSPAVVYTCNEEEANDLVECLRGCVVNE